MKKRIFLILVLVFVSVLTFQGCSFAKDYLGQDERSFKQMAPGAPMPLPEAAPMRAGVMAMKAEGAMETETFVPNEQDSAMVERKIIYTADVRVEVKSCDGSISKLKAVVEEVNGIVADTSVTEYDEGYKTAQVVIRVPADKFEYVLEKMKDLGKVKSQNAHGDEITEEYFDLQIRLANAERMEKRLLELLEKESNKLKDMLEVEKELGRVRENIERMEGRKRYFDARVSMSTITVNLYEPYKYTSSVLDPVKKAVDKVGELFMKSLGAVLLFVAAIIPWVLVIWLVIHVIVKLRGRRRKKKAEKKEGLDTLDNEEKK